MSDVNVFYIDMNGKVAETVCENEDGSYTIFLNSRLCQERLVEAYKHAMKHIQGADFDLKSSASADRIEKRTHKE